MLPESDDVPSCVAQVVVGLAIALEIASQFGFPPGGVVGGLCSVLGAGVPEATVDEHCDPSACEEDVSSPARQPRQRRIDPEPPPAGMQEAAQGNLGLGVASALTAHSGADLLRGPGQVLGHIQDRHTLRRQLPRRSRNAHYDGSTTVTGGMGVAQEIIRSLDLFAGAGGLTEGLHQAGDAIRTVRAVEWDRAAAATFDANHGRGLTYAGSIDDWLATEEVPDVDLVVGGPPCQGFSALNRERVGVERNQLWQRYAETIARACPKWFVLENVSNFRKAPEYGLFEEETLPGGRLADWTFQSRVLLTADYGSHQLRKRTVVLGHHRDLPAPVWPAPTHTRESYASVADAFERLDSEVTQKDLPDRFVTYQGNELPGEFLTSELHITRFYTPRSIARFKHIPAGGNRFDLPDRLKSPCWLNHTSGSADVMGRLSWNKPSVTIRTEFFKPEKGRYLHPTENRALTHHEAARLQGFPDTYRWVGSKVQIAKQIGNAVPVELGRVIGEAIIDAATAAPLDDVA